MRSVVCGLTLVVCVLLGATAVASSVRGRDGALRPPATVEIAVHDAVTRIAVGHAAIHLGDELVGHTDGHGRAVIELATPTGSLVVTAPGYAPSRQTLKREGRRRLPRVVLFMLPALRV